MAKERQKWTVEEEEALLAGVEKHGQGKWKVILTDPDFASVLANRSNIDLKDKWRNICVNRDKVTTPMLEGVTTNQSSIETQPLSVVGLIEYGGMSAPSTITVDRRTPPDYEAMILEALCSVEDPNGLDTNAILNYIEERFELPENFKRSVTSKLRRLVLTGELEKVDDHFKIKGAISGAEVSRQENDVPCNDDDNHDEEQVGPDNYDSTDATETIEDATSYAVHAVYKAENVKLEVIEALEEADRIGEIADESMKMLKLAEDLHELCLTHGSVLLAP